MKKLKSEIAPNVSSKECIDQIFAIGFKKKYLLQQFLDNELSNWRWAEQNKILSTTDDFLCRLNENVSSDPGSSLDEEGQKLLNLRVKYLLQVLELDEFKKLLSQPEYFGWKNLIKQIQDMVED